MVKGPSLLREINEKRLLTFLRTNGTSSRQEITEKLELSKNTVSIITDKFIKERILREVGIDSKGVGRPRMKLELIPEVFHSVGLLIKHAFCELIVTNYLGSIIFNKKIMMNTLDAEQCLKKIAQLWPMLETSFNNIIGLGIAIPGLVDPVEGIVHICSHLSWKDVNVIELLQKSIPVPILVLNDVKAAALSPEKIVPEEAESTFYLRIDEGVGGAFIHNQKVLNGFNYTAGEVGHLIVMKDGPLCGCGQKGCLEALVAVQNVIGRLEERGVNITRDDLFSNDVYGPHPNHATFSELVQMMVEIGQQVGFAASIIINLFNPEYIVIDSPYNVTEDFKNATIETIRNKALAYPSERTNTVFVRTPLSSAWGMAVAVIRHFETTKFN